MVRVQDRPHGCAQQARCDFKVYMEVFGMKPFMAQCRYELRSGGLWAAEAAAVRARTA